jgi:hypothetical protein
VALVKSEALAEQKREGGIPRSHKTVSSQLQTIRESGDDLEQGRI